MPELVRLGLIVNRGLAVVAIGFAGLWQLDAFDDIAWPSWLPTFERATEFPVGALVGAAVGLFVVVCLVLIGLSVGWTVLRFHDFRLERRGDDLRLTCGLLTRRLSTIPRRRIQFLSVHESLLHRWFGRTSIRVETAGGSGAEDPGREQAMTLGRRWFVPIWPRYRLPELLTSIGHAPARDLVSTQWQSLGPRARRRMVRKSVIVASILGAATTAVFFPWGVAAVPLIVVYGVLHARAAWRYLGYAVTPGTVLFRSGVWTRKISAVGLDAIQVVALTRNPFDRRHGMSTLTIDTAGAGPANHRVRVPYLTDDVAHALHVDLFRRSAKTEFRW
jgi:putative membrane protein